MPALNNSEFSLRHCNYISFCVDKMEQGNGAWARQSWCIHLWLILLGLIHWTEIQGTGEFSVLVSRRI